MPELGQQRAQRQHVDGRLQGGRGDLAGVGLPVDHRERLDLHDVEAPAELEGDQVGLQVGRVPGDLQAEQRVVEEACRASVALARGPVDQRPGVGVAQVARRRSSTSW